MNKVMMIGNLASDTSLVIVPPMAGLIYLAAGRHPVAGMICGYASAQAGFSANLMIAGTDGLLSSITQKAADAFLGAGTVTVDAACNWYFMAASTVLGTLVVQLLPEFFRKFSEYRMLAYGIAVVLVILLRPAGLMGYMELPDLIRKITKKKSTGGA